MQPKKVSESLVVMTELVLPNDTNLFNNLIGGRLMYWMDIAAALSAMKHCGNPVVTASVDNLSFQNAIPRGNVVTIHAQVSRAFNTSMEVHIKVWAEDPLQPVKKISNEAFFTFVALDAEGKPHPVPPTLAETKEEKELSVDALRRRQVRLILGGKMKAEEADALKSLFVKESPQD